MILTEALRARRRASWPRPALDAFIQRKVSEILDFARSHSRYYSQLYKDGPLGAPLHSLPSVRKKDLMEHFEEVVTDSRVRVEEVRRWIADPKLIGRLYLDRYVVLNTSGTTGSVGIFLFDHASWTTIRAVAYARAPQSLPKAAFFARAFTGGNRIATLCATRGHFALRTIFDTRPPWWEKLLVRRKAIEITDPLPALVQQLNDFQPHYLSGYSSILSALAAEQAEGRLSIQPEAVGGGAEPLTSEMRRRIGQAFGARVFDLYGATEAMAIAVEGDCGALHLTEDFCVLEPADADGKPSPEGEWSDKVFVTNFANRIMPIIRYELTDSVRVVPGACSCGSPFRRIELRGRADDTLTLKGPAGIVRVPPIALIALLLDVPGIRQSQMVQDSPTHIQVLIVPEPSADWGRLQSSLSTILRRYFLQSGAGDDLRLDTVRADTIARLPGGKIRQVWNRSSSVL
ncbi:MAG: phenylacetate--CoA ligase family protein [Nitrospirae bacterium]|nr:phenylacetate--CoA ligase family protein [Nitrospirota bacterium]